MTPKKTFTALSFPANEFLRQLADVSPGGGPLAYTYAASVVLPHTGWAPEEFLERFTLDINQLHNQRILERARQSFNAGKYTPFFFSLTAENGNRVHFQAVPRPGIDSEGKACVTMALTAQPPASKMPLGTKTELFIFLEVLPAYVLLIDRDYTVRFSNRVARQIFGECDGKKCYAMLHGRDRPCISCPPFGLLTDKATKVHEWVSSATSTAFRSHSYPFADRDGNTLVLQIGINITAGVRAQHALDLSEQRYRSIAENLTLGLGLVDTSKALITLNTKMESWFGGQAAKGVVMDSLLQYKCCDSSGNCLFSTVLEEKQNQEKEFPLMLPSGEERFFRLVACPILARNRQVRAIVVMLEDITDRRTLAARMQQMQRLEALGSLAGGIAHEINQPLSALHLYASGMQMLVEQGSAKPEQILERLSLILSQADRIRQIISHMRALVMQEDTPPSQAVRFADAVTDALGLVGTQLTVHDIQVSQDLPDNLPPVRANDVQLVQIIINLLVNAMHALDTLPPKPGLEKTIHVSAEQKSEDTLTLHVIDNGPGVAGLHSRVFDPFFTTKDPYKGMGLGLSIVHAFVANWGGSVEAGDNPHGSGAVFSVTLPVAQPGDDLRSGTAVTAESSDPEA